MIAMKLGWLVLEAIYCWSFLYFGSTPALALAACGVVMLTITALTRSTVETVTVLTLVLSVWLCALYGVLVKTGKESWFYVAGLTLDLLVILIFRRFQLEGFRVFWNQASDAMVSGTGRVIPEWELKLEPQQQESSILLFAGFATTLAALVCCGLTSAAPALLAALIPSAVLAGMSLFGAERFFWLLPVLGASVLTLMYSGWQKRGEASSIALSWGICAAAAVILTAAVSMGGVEARAESISRDVHQTIHRTKYETKYTSLPEGDFTDYDASPKKPEPALAVTMTVPHTMYLRGFTGAVFEADRWLPLEQEALAKNKDLLYWLNLNAFDQNAQFDAAAAYTQLPQSTVTVQNIGACSYYQYVPFSIVPGAWTQPENLNSNGVYADGVRNQVYTVSVGTGENISRVLAFLSKCFP